LLLALLIWRLMERAMRLDVDTPNTPLAGVGQASDGAAHQLHDGHAVCGGDCLQAQRPAATCSPALGGATPVSDGPRRTGHVFHASHRRAEITMAAQRLSRRQKHILQWLAADHRRTRGMVTSSHQELVRVLPGAKGNISHRLPTLEARGLIVISRSPGGKAEALWRTPERQHGVSQLAGSCD